jgi:hypothetical protein
MSSGSGNQGAGSVELEGDLDELGGGCRSGSVQLGGRSGELTGSSVELGGDSGDVVRAEG